MNKKEFNKIVKASGRDFKIIEFGSGSEKNYALYEGGELIYSDAANLDLYDFETAMFIFAQAILDDYIPYRLRITNKRGEWELKPIVKVSGIKKAVSELKGYKYGKAFLNLDNGKIEVIETTSYSDYEMPNGGNYLYMLRHSKYNNPATMERFRKSLEELAHDYEYKVIIEF